MKNFIRIIVLSICIQTLLADTFGIYNRKSKKVAGLNAICKLNGINEFVVNNPNSDYRGWIGCFNGNAYEGNCNEGYYFNVQLQKCDYEENVKSRIRIDLICDSDNEGLFMEHPSDCRGWMLCFNGKAIEGFCPEGFFFNEKNQVCDFPENVFCPWLTTTTTTVNPLCENITDGLFTTHPSDCNGFIWCSNGNAFIGSCPKEFYFNEDDQTCDFPENVNCPWSTPTPTAPTVSTPEITTSTEMPITTTTSLPEISTTDIITTTTVLTETTPTEFPETTTTTDFPETTTTTDLPETTTTDLPETTTTTTDLPETTTTTDLPETTTTTIVPETTATTIVPETTSTIVPETTTVTELPETTTTMSPDTTTMVPETFNPCVDQPDGFIASLTRCNGWYRCESGIATEGRCNAGQYFDPDRKQCDWAENVNCTINELCNGVFDREFIADPEDCQGWYRCEREQAFHGFCPAGFLFSEPTQLCDYPENVDCSICINVPDNTFVTDSTNCQGFYLCRNGESTWNRCPDGFFFNMNKQVCDTEENVACALNQKCSGKPEGHLISHPLNCAMFFRCIRGETHADNCPENFYFTEEHQACDYPENVECLVNPLCVDIEGSKKVANPIDCREWYLCENGVATVGQCTNNYSFSEEKQECVPSETFECPIDDQCMGIANGMFVSNPIDCQGWYRCDSGIAVSGSCLNGFYFTEIYQACDYTDNVDCTTPETTIVPPTVITTTTEPTTTDPITTTEPTTTNPITTTETTTTDSSTTTETTTTDPITTTEIVPNNPCIGLPNDAAVNNPESCDQFFICWEETPIPQICPDGQYFDNRINQCNDKENVDCIDELKLDRCYQKPDNTFLPHLKYCEKWFLCLNGESIPGTCTEPYLFNPINQICDFAYNVICSDKRE